MIEKLAPSLAWPVVALLALLVLRKHFVILAQGITKLYDLLGKGGEVATLMDRLNEVKARSDEVTKRLTDLKTEAGSIKEMLETLSIKDQSKELVILAEQSAAPDNGAAPISLDDMFSRIEDAWQSVKTAIQLKAKPVGVTPYLMGTKGVASTLGELVEKGAITKRSADLAKAVSAQYQWFYRTSSPREDWLTQQVYSSFLEAADEAKKALERRAG